MGSNFRRYYIIKRRLRYVMFKMHGYSYDETHLTADSQQKYHEEEHERPYRSPGKNSEGCRDDDEC